jgi:hypothetical protein
MWDLVGSGEVNPMPLLRFRVLISFSFRLIWFFTKNCHLFLNAAVVETIESMKPNLA